MSKTGKLGFVVRASDRSGELDINAYEMGALQMNPKATVTVIFHRRLERPGQGTRPRLRAMADQGIDVIGQHVDTRRRRS